MCSSARTLASLDQIRISEQKYVRALLCCDVPCCNVIRVRILNQNTGEGVPVFCLSGYHRKGYLSKDTDNNAEATYWEWATQDHIRWQIIMNLNRGEMFKDQSKDGRTNFESHKASREPRSCSYRKVTRRREGGEISNLSSFWKCNMREK